MTSIDEKVGERIRARRLALGMTQTELAARISVRFQQVQKYENGQNRVAASRLWQISSALDVPVSFFFDAEIPVVTTPFGLDTRRKRELVDLFTSLSEPQQSAVMSFLRSVSETAAD